MPRYADLGSPGRPYLTDTEHHISDLRSACERHETEISELRKLMARAIKHVPSRLAREMRAALKT